MHNNHYLNGDSESQGLFTNAAITLIILTVFYLLALVIHVVKYHLRES